ncbi:M3 family metallopeptidase [Pseudolysinimonas sp.]|jgi:peptidyl-dipeptidase Dcp|uniref:M3 family metallopeptidase n=1 Tax=Pseudolysinimonas sp. TaxID=2680009 RepID=UPI003784B5A9
MSNPFFAPSTLPSQLPPFADIADAHYEEAFETGMAEQLAEISAITRRRDVPMFENTFPALESSGQTLARVSRVFFNKSSADSTEFTNELEERIAPRLAAHEDAILLDPFLYARVKTVYENPGENLTAEDRYLVERWYLEMTLAGAGLDETQKDRLKELNQQLATLTTKFEKNLLADTNDLAVHLTDVADLDGLEGGEISAAAEAAAARGLDGFLVTLVLPTGHPFLAQLTKPEVREKIMAASRARGSRGGEFDNTGVLLEIVRLRAERAELLGFANHAAYVTQDETAGTPDAVAAMLGKLAPAAARNARAEQADLEQLAGRAVTAADWSYYTEKVRQQKYDVDTAALRPWFEAERVLKLGVFGAAHALYGITFTERTDLVAYHPDVRVFEVVDGDGTSVGLYLLDLYTRDSKRGGAWMNSLITQNSLLEHPAIVVNNLNVPKPAAGEPTLLTFDEVSTFFHEFGHALHGLFARVTYPKLAGTNVFRDFVEFPSQVNEMWMLWPEVLDAYAIHYETGDPIDAGVVERIRASETFNEGHATSEYLAAALLDQAWHTLTADEAAAITDVAAFEAAALAKVGLDNPAVPTRYSSAYFAHTFAGGYDAGYYSYIWSEVLDADTVEWFTQNGGLTRSNGNRFRELLLGVGGSKDPLEAYREFRGRDAVIEPLLARRGLN